MYNYLNFFEKNQEQFFSSLEEVAKKNLELTQSYSELTTGMAEDFFKHNIETSKKLLEPDTFNGFLLKQYEAGKKIEEKVLNKTAEFGSLFQDYQEFLQKIDIFPQSAPTKK